MKTRKKRIVLLTLAGCALIAIISAFLLLSTSQEIAIDVNPSVQIYVNRMNRVIKVRPLNYDADRLLWGYSGKGQPLEKVTNDIVERMAASDYFSPESQNEILVTVKGGSRADQTQNLLNESLSHYLSDNNLSTQLYVETIDWDNNISQSAEIAGVSPGKLAIALEAADGDIQQATQLANLSVDEIFNGNDDDFVPDEDILNHEELDTENTDLPTEITTEPEPDAPADEVPEVSSSQTAQQQAEQTFINAFGISPEKTKLQDGGSIYYMYAQSGHNHYKMKVRVSDGAIVYQYPESIQADEVPASRESSTPSEVATGGSVTQEQAENIFVDSFGLSPQKTKLQDGGSIYYMYAQSGGTHYKMKVRVSNGEVVYSNSGGGNYSGNNRSYKSYN